MIKKYVFAAVLLSCTAAARAQNGIIRQSDIEKAKSITRQMTLEEKISYISGYKDFYNPQNEAFRKNKTKCSAS